MNKAATLKSSTKTNDVKTSVGRAWIDCEHGHISINASDDSCLKISVGEVHFKTPLRIKFNGKEYTFNRDFEFPEVINSHKIDGTLLIENPNSMKLDIQCENCDRELETNFGKIEKPIRPTIHKYVRGVFYNSPCP